MKTNPLIAPFTAVLLTIPFAAVAPAATVVWNGAPIAFAKAAGADFTLLQNQDRLTDQVWLTRGNSQGLFNIRAEPSFAHSFSPAGTAWAFGTTANYDTLSYTNWEAWTGGAGGGPPNTVGKDAVLHLIGDDIYLDIKFISWGGNGGGFSYLRSTPVPEPGGFVLLGIGTLLLASRRRRPPALLPALLPRTMKPLAILPRSAMVALAGSLVFAPPVRAVDVLPSIPKGTIAIKLRTVATGLGAPDYAVSPPGDTARLFILEQKGLILILQNDVLLPTPALDIQSLVAPPLNPASLNDERGLLGLAFHPGFSSPTSPGYRTLYTYNSQPLGTGPTYVAPNGASQGYQNAVNEWKLSAADPNLIDPLSRREIISFGKNAGNHNGGTITFGPDGYLYLGLGDGGNSNDVGLSHIEPGGNAQNLSTPLGKMLRFDPLHPSLTPASADPASANGQYRIPVSNPFQGVGQVREIYALGLRNPYRFSFDWLNGALIVADVGQNTVEEINRVTLGANLGWPVKEGDFLFNRTTGPVGAAGTVGVRRSDCPPAEPYPAEALQASPRSHARGQHRDELPPSAAPNSSPIHRFCG